MSWVLRRLEDPEGWTESLGETRSLANELRKELVQLEPVIGRQGEFAMFTGHDMLYNG